MAARRSKLVLGILIATSLCGCSRTIDLYHDAEGGAIAKHRQPPPGANLPYPNLADVPAIQAPATPTQAQDIAHQAQAGVSAASSSVLEGLSLPSAPPPVPVIPGLRLSTATVPPLPAQPTPVVANGPAPEPVQHPIAAPVSIAFRPGSALLSYKQKMLVEGVAAHPGNAKIRVCGFGDGSLDLALARARRLANALTAAGVPGQAIEIEALAAGSGGFVQLVY